jgi:Ribbon-helix-helix domain
MRIELPDQTIREVELMLAKRGEAADVPAFIDRTLQRALLFETVREVKRQNAEVPREELDRLIDDAVEAVRAEQNRATPDANGA